MKTKSLISDTTQIIRITTFVPGDIYKRLGNPDYNGDSKFEYGTILDVVNNGETQAITALEYSASYTSIATAEIKVFRDAKGLDVFPVTLEEYTKHLAAVETAATKQVETKVAELRKAKTIAAEVAGIVARVAAGELTSPEVSNVIEADVVELTK